MTAGRKTKPNALKLIENNPGGRPLPDEIEIEGAIGEPPEWFEQDETDAWNDVVEAAPPGLLTAVDANLLTIYSQAVAEYKEASLRLKKEGYIVEASRGAMKRNDWVLVKNKAAELMLKAGSEMGFTPASRSKVSTGNGKGKSNKFGSNGKK
jgi:P27 family predicted phage terminase small subunit